MCVNKQKRANKRALVPILATIESILFMDKLLSYQRKDVRNRQRLAICYNAFIYIISKFIISIAVSAHATKCLPHASEIEVETGPYFGGRIVSEGGNDCGVDGDPLSEQDRYVMRIDHDKCGSKVNHDTLTVETFITVQENIGIFTHSTRR